MAVAFIKMEDSIQILAEHRAFQDISNSERRITAVPFLLSRMEVHDLALLMDFTGNIDAPLPNHSAHHQNPTPMKSPPIYRFDTGKGVLQHMPPIGSAILSPSRDGEGQDITSPALCV